MIGSVVRGLRTLRDETGETHLLALVRIVFGFLLLNEAWLATQHLSDAGFFGDYFHQPMWTEAWVPSEATYRVIVAVQWAAAVAIVTGWAARPALLVAAALLVYTMLADRLWFHHYRHTMAAFSTLLAFAPCDRRMVLGRPDRQGTAPIWAANAIKAQVSLMYLASGGSKAVDPDWRGGLMMRGMIKGFARLMAERGVPGEWLSALQTPLGASLFAKGAIATELSLAVLLWWSPTRRIALWVGVVFHLLISLMTPVLLFTAEMLAVYLVYVRPDREARVLRCDKARDPFAGFVDAFDWFARYRIDDVKGATRTVIERDGRPLQGVQAIACLFGTIPLLFAAWPLVAAAAWLRRRFASSGT